MLIRKATYFTPNLLFEDGLVCISGKLWMENAPKYFEKIFIHTQSSNSKTFLVELNVEHLNSSSIKQILEYFKLLKELKENGKFEGVTVTWNISEDDVELINLIQDLEDISELKIEIIKKKTQEIAVNQ